MKRTVLLLALLGLLFTVRLGAPGFWEKDEARYAQAAREMRRSGDYVVPTLGGAVRLNKPPLLYWLIAAGQAAFGETELASRLPSVVAAILTAWLLFFWARRIAGEAAGWFAAIVHATAVQAAGMGRLAHPESLLVLGIAAALVCFHLAWREDFSRRRRLVLMWLAMGGGFLAKGPHAIILPLLVIFVFLLLRRDLRAFARLMPIRGLLLALAPVVIWGLLVVLDLGWSATGTWLHETRDRYFGALDHPEPFWFFVPILAGGFLPWTLWIPAAIGALRRRDEAPAAGLYLLVWAATVLVFFSIGESKTSAYMLSAIPPLSVAVGIGLARLRCGGGLLYVGVVHGVVLAGLGAAAGLLRPLPPELSADPAASIALAAVFGAALLAVAAAAFAGRPRAAARLAAGGFAATLLVGMAFVAPAANRDHSARELGRTLAAILEPTDRLVNLEQPRAGLLWYTDHPVEEDPGFFPFLEEWDGPGRVFVFAHDKRRRRIERKRGKQIVVWSDADSKHVVLTNRPLR